MEALDAAKSLYGSNFKTISSYVDLLASDGVEWGLIGPRETDRLWDRHILNSAALASLIPAGASVIDVGSGAGLPGIPLAILRPDVNVTLLEPLLRRFTFLTHSVEKLGISDTVSVVRGRADQHNARYDVVTARAVAPLDRLVGWTSGLRRDHGVILALKGRSADDEVAAASEQLSRSRLRASVLTVRAHQDAEPTTVVRLASA